MTHFDDPPPCPRYQGRECKCAFPDAEVVVLFTADGLNILERENGGRWQACYGKIVHDPQGDAMWSYGWGLVPELVCSNLIEGEHYTIMGGVTEDVQD